MLNRLWLPEGVHWGLRIEHKRLPDAGAFTTGVHMKLIWHTTESSWLAVDAMFDVLRDKDAAPHLIIGARKGSKEPVVIQTMPLTASARALEHPAGTLETNRARCIQIEVCGRAAESHDWDDNIYRALANLTVLIEHRQTVHRKHYHDFASAGNATRLTPEGFIEATSQHLGHEHVPSQPSGHWDPGRFDIKRLFHFCATAPNVT